VFITPFTADPGRSPDYYGRARVAAIADPAGDVTQIREPNPYQWGAFDVVGTVQGDPGSVTTQIEQRMDFNISKFRKLKAWGCAFDVYIPRGECSSPDVLVDAEVISIIEQARATAYNTGDIGALEPGQAAAVNEMLPVSGQIYYEIKGPMQIGELAASTVTRRIIDIEACDRVSCGVCGSTSAGCGKIFAVSIAAGGSPGLPADVIYSSDGGATWAKTNIDTLGLAESPSAAACVGAYFVVVSNDSGSIHYADQSDILNGVETWTENAGGIVVTGEPNAIFALAPTAVWLVGDLGYVYGYTNGITQDAVVLLAGTLTTQNLNSIHGSDADNLVAVGDANAVIYSGDSGVTWSSVTGPAVGVDLNVVWARDTYTWLVGTAGGQLWYTNDQGTNWTQITFPGSSSGSVDALVFANTPSGIVGWMSHTLAGVGRLFRSIDGGSSWTLMPTTGTGPVADAYNAIAVCEDVNIAFAGGLGSNGTDGIIVKVA
jgi:photosystem II stability/assembly factor-like uncharacterized protein